MTTYASLAEFKNRYQTNLDDDHIGEHFLPYAARRVDEMLAQYFETPFEADNLTVKDLTIDIAYMLIVKRSKNSSNYDDLKQSIEQRIEALINGSQAMITSSGHKITSKLSTDCVWSSQSTENAD